ncbi:MAG: BMP family ABC transporter substrate-binding protein [Acutalibacteraceae bacterium]|nr:BMP family ABC transporter substrate-binding protein [Acutalibacteraceae bacterium]
MKKLLALLLAVAMIFGLAACGGGNSAEDFKVGFICLHDEKSTYDLNFLNGVDEVKKTLGLKDSQVIIMTNIPEGDECYQAAADLVDQGCDVIFANSFGHEDFMIKAAKEFTDVQFCHATGTKAHTEGLANYHNAFASIYQGRYLAGIAAGLKLNEMITAGKITADEAKMGYVGAFTYAEVISGYTSFYLGAKSVCPSVTMEVQFTGSWYDAPEEKNAAEALIAKGCVLISQHADSMGAPSACEAAGVPNVSYNGSTVAACPNTFIVSSRINWAPYYEYMIKCVQEGKAIDTDWCGGLEQGSVVLTDVNEKAAAAGTADAIKTATEGLKNGTVNVFDTKNFTVGGVALASHKVEDKEVIENGIFNESKLMSAPYFDLRIDGITLLNEKF